MAHEELKKLYEIDKQHSETPWQWWEFEVSDRVWGKSSGEPIWGVYNVYRRNPLAPVWDAPFADMLYQLKRSIVEEDARKWRELEAFYQGNGIMDTAKKFLEIIDPKPQLIQGYTAEQWQTIIDGKFLCEFSDVDFSLTIGPFIIGRLYEIKPWKENRSFTGHSSGFMYCRPLRIKGVRQPWFGGECPVASDSRVSITMRDGEINASESAELWTWEHCDVDGDIVEFIEL